MVEGFWPFYFTCFCVLTFYFLVSHFLIYVHASCFPLFIFCVCCCQLVLLISGVSVAFVLTWTNSKSAWILLPCKVWINKTSDWFWSSFVLTFAYTCSAWSPRTYFGRLHVWAHKNNTQRCIVCNQIFDWLLMLTGLFQIFKAGTIARNNAMHGWCI